MATSSGEIYPNLSSVVAIDESEIAMLKDTPSMAKNKIKRCLGAILDPHPDLVAVGQLWDHFGSKCAYCGITLDRHSRQGHLDHAVSTALSGGNSIYSNVLACGRCNGDEKREESWETFLAKKCPSAEILSHRRARIRKWLAKAGPNQWYSEELRRQAQTIIDEALASFDRAVVAMRRLRDGA
jgi:hypothetical protein